MQDAQLRDEAEGDARRVGARQPELDAERAGNEDNQRHDERFHVAEAVVLEKQHDEHVERGKDDAPDKGQLEEQVEGDGRADDFGEVARRDGHFAEDP